MVWARPSVPPGSTIPQIKTCEASQNRGDSFNVAENYPKQGLAVYQPDTGEQKDDTESVSCVTLRHPTQTNRRADNGPRERTE